MTRPDLLVAGMHRSGTSAVTRVLNLLGWHLPDHLVEAGEGNRDGHWEPFDLVRANEARLAALGRRWDDWRALPQDRLTGEDAGYGPDLAARIAADHPKRPWVIKDPRIARLLPEYRAALGDDVAVLMVLRDPGQVIASLMRRSSWPQGAGAIDAGLLWLRHVIDAERDSRGLRRAAMRSDAFMRNWHRTLGAALASAGIAMPDVDAETAADIDAFLRPDDSRDTIEAGRGAVPPEMRPLTDAVWAAATALTADPDDPAAMAALDEAAAWLDRIETITEAQGAGLADRATRAENRAEAAVAEAESLRHFLDRQNRHITNLDGELARLATELDHRTTELAKADGERSQAQLDLAQSERQRARQDAMINRMQAEIERREAGERLLLAEITRIDDEWQKLRRRSPTVQAGRAYRAGRAAFGILRANLRRSGFSRTYAAFTLLLRNEGLPGVTRKIRTRLQAQAAAVPGNGELSCLIVTTPHTRFIANMMARILAEDGFFPTISESTAGAGDFIHVFVLCPQMFEDIPDEYIAVQMEQSVSSRWFTPDYFAKLRRARGIMDYSIRNIDFLRDNGIEGWRLYYTPIDTDRTIHIGSNVRRGILFVGDDKNPRRQAMLDVLRAEFPDLRVENNLFGDALTDALRSAAVVLNIHYYEGALLETTRIHEALSHGCRIVSEVSADQDEHAALDGIVDFVPLGDTDAMVAAIHAALTESDGGAGRLQAIEDHAHRDSNRFEASFRRLLLGQRMIGFDRFCEMVPDWPVAKLHDRQRLCLSLPETPARRAQFRAQGRHHFNIWDGLKAVPGWVGAALSYKQMFTRLRDAGVEQATICEDDVLFPEDFDRRMATVERYLQGHDWDIFSGFIADAHPELQVLAVEEFEGVTFAHIDKAISMVFNIYSRGMIDYLADWDEADRDVDGNTIDRYLERRRGMRVIVALPFLVGHREDTQSTIWGFENTQYAGVLAETEKLLERKVAEFRAALDKAG